MTIERREARFPKPKILLVDLPEGATSRLASAGFNVQAGTFGRPYRVAEKERFSPVIPEASLPNHTEQEVIIIDLYAPEPQAEHLVREADFLGASNSYVKPNKGLVDSRSMAMSMISDDWHRILESGGAFVIFAEPRVQQEITYGTLSHGSVLPLRSYYVDNWSFLSILNPQHFDFRLDSGTESQLIQAADFLETFLRSHQRDLHFGAVWTPADSLTGEDAEYRHESLMKSKFGETIGGIVKAPGEGRILILPHFKDKVRAVYELVTTVLPELSRHLFPGFEGDRWVHSVEYEHPTVLEQRTAQQRIREEAEARITALESQIEAEAGRLKFLHGIITGTGDSLVDDVQEVLRLIGFEKVGTPPEEKGVNKQEDLQIQDRASCLLLEVKGLAGQPREGDTHQCNKYVFRRMKEWERTNVKGVFVVNHQRNLPALDRDHENVFTEQQLQDAAESGMGLITTWDLFRLVRGMIRWGWPGEVVQNVLYGQGRLPSIPSHYVEVGLVAHFYSSLSVLSIDVTGPGMQIGNRIGILLDTGFYEERIASLQVDRTDVTEVQPGQRVGCKTALLRKDVPVGVRVYLVSSTKGECT